MAKSSKFLFGAIVGALAAAFLTPVSGKKAREKVSKLAKKSGIDQKQASALLGVLDDVKKKGIEIFEQVKKENLDKKINSRISKTKNKTK